MLVVPAGAQDAAYGIAAPPQEAGDIVGDIEGSRIVARESGIELVAAHSNAVEIQLVPSQAADVSSSPADFIGQVELPTQERRG